MRTPFYLPAGDPRHGLNGYNNLGCCCEICTEANRLYQAAYLANHPEQRQKERERDRRRYRQRRGELGVVPFAERRSQRWPLCAVEDCPKNARGSTFCEMHYRRFLRHGDPSVVLRPGGRTHD